MTITIYFLFLEFEYTERSRYQYFVSWEPCSTDHRDFRCNCSTSAVTAEPLTKGQMNRKLRTQSITRIQASVQTTQAKGKLGTTFLLIMVPILFSSIKSRDLIRDTWYKGFRDSEDVMLRYIMGVNGLNDSQINKLHEENKTHGDLVFLDNFTEGICMGID